jgi:hypothetical protein
MAVGNEAAEGEAKGVTAAARAGAPKPVALDPDADDHARGIRAEASVKLAVDSCRSNRHPGVVLGNCQLARHMASSVACMRG